MKQHYEMYPLFPPTILFKGDSTKLILFCSLGMVSMQIHIQLNVMFRSFRNTYPLLPSRRLFKKLTLFIDM